MREARISRDKNNDPIGLALFLNPAELQELGIDPEGDTVEYWVEEGQLCLRTGDS